MLTRPRRYGSDREQTLTSYRCRTGHLLSIGTGTTINPSDVVRDLGVLFDSVRTDDEKAYCQGRSCLLLPHSPTPPDLPPCRQRCHHPVHPPCVGFDNAAVGLQQLGVRGTAAVDTRAVTESAERRYSACV